MPKKPKSNPENQQNIDGLANSLSSEDVEPAAIPNPRNATFIAEQEIRYPAHLLPGLINKFDKEDIKNIVSSFTDSVSYQNETDRKAMEKHYRTVNWTQTKRMIYSTLVVGAGFYGLYISKNLSLSWVLVLIGIGLFEAPHLFEGISEILKKISGLWKSDKDNNK